MLLFKILADSISKAASTEAVSILWVSDPGKKFFDKVIKKSKTRINEPLVLVSH